MMEIDFMRASLGHDSLLWQRCIITSHHPFAVLPAAIRGLQLFASYLLTITQTRNDQTNSAVYEEYGINHCADSRNNGVI